MRCFPPTKTLASVDAVLGRHPLTSGTSLSVGPLAELAQRSDRTYFRIIASQDPATAFRYGCPPIAEMDLEGRLRAAFTAGDWQAVAQLSKEPARTKRHRA